MTSLTHTVSAINAVSTYWHFSERELSREIKTAYSEETRHYHDLKHLNFCLVKLDELEHLAKNITEIKTAILFHDFVYNSRSSTNEEDSVRAFEQILGDKISPKAEERISKLILCTKHQQTPNFIDGKIIVDMDLSSFSKNRNEFLEDEAKIRKEYSYIPIEEYRVKKIEFLRKLLGRKSIYQTALFQQKYEQKARNNIQHLIDKYS